MSSHSLSLVLPGYNEEANVEQAVRGFEAALRALVPRYEILIVDDGSTDATPEIADRLARESNCVRVIHNPINLGVGTSLLIGMRRAECDLVMHNAMDAPFEMADLKDVLPLFPAHDVVALARIDRSAHSPWRKLTSITHRRLLGLLFRPGLRDLNFVQVYKREVLQAVKVKARSPAFVTAELLIRARNHGFKIAQVSATFHPRRRGQASYGKPRDILWALSDMLSYRLDGR